MHRDFDDSLKLALGAANEEETLFHYRRVWDEIKAFILILSGALDAEQNVPDH
ncbi:MAG: hypothetical protein BMS9Abin36_0375 [Gammaproteobacteria bacterium]|nr:MAG: hypothetical protein BMS9Abin36_0375 [Gammaproteobacteria bacterium]